MRSWILRVVQQEIRLVPRFEASSKDSESTQSLLPETVCHALQNWVPSESFDRRVLVEICNELGFGGCSSGAVSSLHLRNRVIEALRRGQLVAQPTTQTTQPAKKMKADGTPSA